MSEKIVLDRYNEIFLVEFEVKTLIQLINRPFYTLKKNQNKMVLEDHVPNLELHQSYSHDMLNHDYSIYCTHYQLVFDQSEALDGLGFAYDHIEDNAHRKHYLKRDYHKYVLISMTH